MAISVPNTISELEEMSKSLGLTIQGTKKNGVKSKEDYIIPIRNRILSDRYEDNIPEYLKLIQNIKSPMLCKRFDEVNNDLKDEIWNDEMWDFEEKINGLRCLIIKDSSGLHIMSRENSKVDLLPIDMSERIFINSDVDRIVENFILDCEIVENSPDLTLKVQRYGISASNNVEVISTMLLEMNKVMSRRIQRDVGFRYTFYIFDCIYYDDNWLMNSTLVDRRKILMDLYNRLKQSSLSFRIPEHANIDKKKFYEKCLSYGFEGCVCKRLDSLYIPDTVRNLKGWMKVKKYHTLLETKEKSVSEDIGIYEGLCDTIDGFITGYTPGEKGTMCEKLIYEVKVSFYVNEEKKDIFIHNIEARLRNTLTSLVNNEPTLNPNYFNSVVELNALGNLIIGIRYDKSPEECILSDKIYKTLFEKNNC